MQRVHAQRRGLVVLEGEEIEARAALEEGLRVELGPAQLAGTVSRNCQLTVLPSITSGSRPNSSPTSSG